MNKHVLIITQYFIISHFHTALKLSRYSFGELDVKVPIADSIGKHFTWNFLASSLQVDNKTITCEESQWLYSWLQSSHEWITFAGVFAAVIWHPWQVVNMTQSYFLQHILPLVCSTKMPLLSILNSTNSSHMDNLCLSSTSMGGHLSDWFLE